MATCSSTLAWRFPWTEEFGRLQSIGLERDTTEHVRACIHTHARAHTHTHTHTHTEVMCHEKQHF